MVTITRTVTTETDLETPDEIAEHVHGEFLRRQAAAPFVHGDQVRITKRDGLLPEFLVGDVGTVLWCEQGLSPLTQVLGLNAYGQIIQFGVQTANLVKADA